MYKKVGQQQQRRKESSEVPNRKKGLKKRPAVTLSLRSGIVEWEPSATKVRRCPFCRLYFKPGAVHQCQQGQ